MHLTDNEQCFLCATGSVESIEHFLLDCPFYDSIRKDEFMIADTYLRFSGLHLSFLELPPTIKLHFLIGDIGYYVCEKLGHAFNKIGMTLLSKMFESRSEYLKSQGVNQRV